MRKSEHPFDRAGFACVSDLEREETKSLLEYLEIVQSDFLNREVDFRSPGYKWPRDPLHTWSRIWEYPYAYYHLQKAVEQKLNSGSMKVADIGSGVTFFPFSVARLGCDVTCVDIDPICALDIPAASKVVNCFPGTVSCGLLADGKIPLQDCSQDVVYCISVLEHIPNFEETLQEIARILKPNGTFILTVDIDLRGNFELSKDGFGKMQELIDAKFDSSLCERTMHPADYLLTSNSPHNIKNYSIHRIAKRTLELLTTPSCIFGDVTVGTFLTVYANVYKKRPVGAAFA